MKLNDEARSLHEASVRAHNDLAKVAQQVEEIEKAICALLAEASASNQQEFLERAEIYKQRRQLIHELEKIPVEMPESGLLFDMRADEEAASQAAQNELAELKQRLVQARHETGRIEERITIIKELHKMGKLHAKLITE